jgi:hypothetical protein
MTQTRRVPISRADLESMGTACGAAGRHSDATREVAGDEIAGELQIIWTALSSCCASRMPPTDVRLDADALWSTPLRPPVHVKGETQLSFNEGGLS